MTAQYLILAVVLAVALNHANRFVRAGGTLLAAIGLIFIIASIILADFDGTFAAAATAYGPQLLNVQAVLASVAVVFLLWATLRQMRRTVTTPLPVMNTPDTFGLISRYAHWSSATLILCLVPMGVYIAVLPTYSPDRSLFVAVHETLGVTVLVLILLRLAWRARSSPPALPTGLKAWERRLASVMQKVVYSIIIGLPVTGLLLVTTQGEPIELYGWVVPLPAWSGDGTAWLFCVLHNQILPMLFYAVIAMHLGAVLKHHFVARRRGDVRRMLR